MAPSRGIGGGRCHVVLVVITTVLIGVLVAQLTFAGGPFEITGSGEPVVWSTAEPVPFHTDQGTLGSLSNAEAVALVQAAFQVWEDVPTASITFESGGSLAVDVNGDNVFTVLDVEDDGISPIVFDHDGSVIDAVLGFGASANTLGFAAIETTQGNRILEAQAVLNGAVLDGNPSNPDVSPASFMATIAHEFGHYINLDHTQINGNLAFDNDPNNDDGVPTMFPVASDGDEKTTLHRDDVATVSVLYPSPSFLVSTGSIEGEILLGNGVTPFQGANVIARNTGDPILEAVSYVSGALFTNTAGGGSANTAFQGQFKISGLLPGNYTVEVEQIDRTFVGGSSLNPLDPPAILPGPEEFYNGMNEAGATALDDPTEKTEIVVSAGEVMDEIDILLNTSEAAEIDIGLALALTKFKHKIRAVDDRITAKLRVANVGAVSLGSPTSVEMWISSDDLLDRDRDDLVAMEEIPAEDLPLGAPANIKFKPENLGSADGKFAIFVIDSTDENEQQANLQNRIVHDIGGRGCAKDSFRLEQEPNDSSDTGQSLGKIALDECVKLEGVLSNNGTLAIDEDAFRVTTKESLTLEVMLTHSEDNDFDAFIFGPFGDAAVCTQSAGEETCTFAVSETEPTPVDIIISPFSGMGDYTLDIQTRVSDEVVIQLDVFPPF